jgi:hypothetical protein
MAKMAYDMSPAEQQSVLAYHSKRWGIDFPDCKGFLRPEWRHDFNMACDAQPQLVTVASSGIPAYLSFYLDPDVLHILTAKNEAANIFGEEQKGSWIDSTAIFPVVERTYEVASYGDYANSGSSGINTNFPERQAYLYQTFIEYGDFEIERAGLAKINFVSEIKEAAIDGLNKFQNLTYFRGVAGLQNYGILNDPSLFPAIAPIPKAAGGVSWANGNVINGTANEIFADVQNLVFQLISQSSGNINVKSEIILAMSPKSENALTATNTFNVNVMALLKNNYPNLRVETAIQYGALTAQNPQGSALGEIVQAYAPKAEGQKTGFTSFNTKLRAGTIIREPSAWKQKFTQGTWGFILRQPYAVATLVGV